MKTTEDYQGMIYAVGYSYGTSSRGTTYANVIVGKENSSIRSQFSVYCDDELAEQLGIDLDSLDYPAKGERAKRVALDTPVALFEGTLATVEHAPIQINDRTYRTMTVVVGPDDSLAKAVDAAVQRRFDNVDAQFFPKGEFAKDYQKYILPDSVGRDELLNWLKALDC